jgi:hypothetical protein
MKPKLGAGIFTLLMLFFASSFVHAQPSAYPKEIRGYKVERAAVEMKTSANGSKTDKSRDPAPGSDAPPASDGVDQLITFSAPELARITPLGITFNVAVVVAPVKQSGHVHFLFFENMQVNGHSVEIEDYDHAFDLPNKQPMTLRDPLRFYIYSPTAVLAAADEWSNSKETWPVTGRVYVCGKFKKSIFSFKRCVPVELNLKMRNPLRGK